jgi:hypothetical protein
MLKRVLLATIAITAFTFAADEKKKQRTPAERRKQLRTSIREVHDLLEFAIKKFDELDKTTTEQFDLLLQKIQISDQILKEKEQLVDVKIQLLDKQFEFLDMKMQLLELEVEENRCRCNEKS